MTGRRSMHLDRKRLAGAAGVALFGTLMFAVGQLLDREIDVAALAGVFLMSALVGYLAWPGLADVWARRDRGQDGKRFLMIGLGLVTGVALSRVITALAGEDDAK